MDKVNINLKLRHLDLQYEGPQDFAENGIFDLIKELAGLSLPDIVPCNVANVEGSGALPQSAGQVGAENLSVSDFAVKLRAKSGTDLVMAAAAYLHHTKGMEEFSRSEIFDAMKGAKAFYRISYGSNLTKSLNLLVKTGRLQCPRSDAYALPYSEIEKTKNLQ